MQHLIVPRLVDDGIAVCGPPCSLMVGASSSVHMLALTGRYGEVCCETFERHMEKHGCLNNWDL